MSLHPQHPVPPVPKHTARIARAAFPKSSPYLTLRDRLGPIFSDPDFADLYLEQGQPAPLRQAAVPALLSGPLRPDPVRLHLPYSLPDWL